MKVVRIYKLTVVRQISMMKQKFIFEGKQENLNIFFSLPIWASFLHSSVLCTSTLCVNMTSLVAEIFLLYHKD